MADDRVIVPIDLMVTDIKTGDVDLKDVEKSIKSRLSGITKSASEVLGTIDTSKLNKSLISSMDKVTSSYQKLSIAQSKMTDALRDAGSSSPKFKKELKAIQTEIDKTERAWEDFADLLLESPVLQSGLEKRDLGLSLSPDEADKVKFFEEQMSRYESDLVRLNSMMPDPSHFISSATTTELQKLINAYYGVFNAVNKVESATEEWNKTRDANMMTDEYTTLFKELESLEKKLMSVRDRAMKMSEVGATGQAWASLQYDADMLAKKIDEISGKLIEMIKTGKAFRFDTGNVGQEATALQQKLQNVAGAMSDIKNAPETVQTRVSGLLRVINNFCTSATKGLAKVINMFKRLGKTSKHTGKSTHKSLRQIYRDILMLGFGVGSTLFLMRRLRNIFIDTFKEMALQIPEVNDQVSFFVRSLNQLKGSVGTAFQPIVSMVIPILHRLTAALTNAMNAIGRFFATLSGQGYIYKFTAAQVDYAESLNKTGSAAKKAQKSLMGFDEINKLNSDDSGSGMEAPTGMWEKEMLNGMSNLAQMLKDAWNKGDFTDVGKFLGEKLLEALIKLDDWITTRGYALADKIGTVLGTLINGITSVAGLGAQIGKTIADALNMSMIGLNAFLTTTDWLSLGQFIADWANASVENFKWDLLGQTIANLITAGVNTWWKFIGEFDFSQLGSKIAIAINNMFSSILSPDDTGLSTAEKLGQAITKTVRGILDTLTTAINETDWNAVGRTIGEVLANIDWGAIAIDFTKLVGAIIKGIAEAFLGWTATDPISAGLAVVLGSALATLNIGASITGLLLKFAPLVESADKLGKAFEIVKGSIGGVAKLVGGVLSIVVGVVMAISNFATMLGNGFNWANEALMLVGIALTAVGAVLLGAPATVAAVIAGVVALIATLVILIKNHGTEVWEFLKAVGTGILETIQTVIQTIIAVIAGIITTILTFIGGLVVAITSTIAIIVGAITTALLAIAGVIATVLQTVLGVISGVLSTIRITITTVITVIYTTIVTILKVILAIITGNFGSIKGIILDGMSAIRNAISNGWNAIRNVWTNTMNAIASSTRAIWNGISNTIKGVINGIIGFVNGMIRGIVSGINAVIGVLNRFKVNIPSWVPQFGGQSFGFNLSTISAPQIPRLAQGGVIPPNKEFMAILGDQKHGTNIEAPLDTIKQAVGEELLEYIDAMMAGFEAVVQAINEKDMDVVIGDSAIGRAADRYNKRQNLVRGTL